MESIEVALVRLQQESSIRVNLCDLHFYGEDGLALPARMQADLSLAQRLFEIMFMTGEGGVNAALAGQTAAHERAIWFAVLPEASSADLVGPVTCCNAQPDHPAQAN